ncbi:uncharacterized protein LOC110706177 [Chenopodium quinoa]|uniref:uncharacterized protein LOC110706177 n=1 Tax=Chenopodium quinoa TaxID=63459 RepID=UPI000B775E11|nr:uncharacterized protein LOC110706177 [Chenopodium quinoa]
MENFEPAKEEMARSLTSGEHVKFELTEGFLISKRGIDANLEKVEVVLSLPEPKRIKDIMRLIGRMAALTRFISKSADKALLFYQLLKGNREFKWRAAEKEAFEDNRSRATGRKTKTTKANILREPRTDQGKAKAIEHSEYEFEVKPWAAIKAQALEEFIVEASYEEKEDDIGIWKVEVDGFSAQVGSGVGVIMTSPEGNVFEYAIKFKFKASNNEAEYEAALAGLRMSIAPRSRKVHLQTDSQLVASQMQGAYEIREATMLKYVTKVKELAAQLVHFQIDLVLRAGNSQADALSKLVSSTLQSLTRTVMVEILDESSIAEKEQVNCIGQQWYTDIMAYKVHGSLPDDEVQARKVKKDANWYVVINGELNKKGFSKPLLRCIPEWKLERFMEEAHSWICANHIGGKAVGVEVVRRGAYWPTLTHDALAYVKKCNHY